MRTILAIDDSLVSLEAIVEVIKMNISDCRVITAKSGDDGIALAKKEQPDLIILDILMPIMDGFEVCEILKKNILTERIPVVMLTGMDHTKEHRIKALNLGADGFFSKPIDPDELSAQINVALRIKKAEDDLLVQKQLVDKKVEEQTADLLAINAQLKLDIAKRKKVEEKLKKSEEHYRALFENIADVVTIINEDGNLLYASPSRKVLIGEDVDEQMEKSAFDLIHPSDVVRIKHEFAELKKNNTALINIEFKVKRTDGKWIDAKGTATNLLNNPHVKGIVITYRDITEQKTASEKISKSEKKFRELIEATHLGVAFCEAIYDNNNKLVDFIYRDMNAASEGFIKVNKEKIIGKKFSETKLQMDLGWLKKFENVLVTGNSTLFEIYHPDIKKYFSVFVYRSEKDVFVTIAEDITDRKLAAMKVQKSETNLRQIIDLVPMLIFAKDIDGKYIMANKAIADVFNTTVENLVGKTDADFLSDNSTTNKFINDDKSVILLNKSLFIPEEQLIDSDGKVKFFQTIKIPFNMEMSEKRVVLGASFDITERKQKEIELIAANKKANESDRLKSSFLRNLSHELRTPMNGISGFSQLLKEDNLSSSDQEYFIESINTSGKRLLDTVDSIIRYSMIESDQVGVSISDFNVSKQVSNIFKELKHIADNKQVNYVFNNLLENNDICIKTDCELLKIALVNLLLNAFKYTQNGTIELGCTVDDSDSHSEIIFSISDTGIGIDNSRLNAIFDPFVQADLEDKDVYEGVGLGLTIAKKYIELLGGILRVESEENIGSTFSFTVPYNTTAKITEDSNCVVNTPSKVSNKLKILIAEDDAVSLEYLVFELKKLKAKIYTAKTGVETVEIIKNNPDIDVILMDIKMPGISGYEATKQIREFNNDVVIIAQTAYALSGDRQKAISYGCNDYLSKPIDADKLLKIIGITAD